MAQSFTLTNGGQEEPHEIIEEVSSSLDALKMIFMDERLELHGGAVRGIWNILTGCVETLSALRNVLETREFASRERERDLAYNLGFRAGSRSVAP